MSSRQLEVMLLKERERERSGLRVVAVALVTGRRGLLLFFFVGKEVDVVEKRGEEKKMT